MLLVSTPPHKQGLSSLVMAQALGLIESVKSVQIACKPVPSADLALVGFVDACVATPVGGMADGVGLARLCGAIGCSAHVGATQADDAIASGMSHRAFFIGRCHIAGAA